MLFPWRGQVWLRTRKLHISRRSKSYQLIGSTAHVNVSGWQEMLSTYSKQPFPGVPWNVMARNKIFVLMWELINGNWQKRTYAYLDHAGSKSLIQRVDPPLSPKLRSEVTPVQDRRKLPWEASFENVTDELSCPQLPSVREEWAEPADSSVRVKKPSVSRFSASVGDNCSQQGRANQEISIWM